MIATHGQLGIQLWNRSEYDILKDEHIYEVCARVNGRELRLRMNRKRHRDSDDVVHEFVTWLQGPRDPDDPGKILERYDRSPA